MILKARRRCLPLFVAVTLAAALATLCACDRLGLQRKPARPLRIHIDAIGMHSRITRELVAEFERETGIDVDIVAVEASASERLTEVLQYLGARSPEVDVFMIDVIWPSILAPRLVDLTQPFRSEVGSFFPRIVQNNTVDGRLIAVPLYADVGLLYYRTDLLTAAGHASPPATWDELESTAREIQTAQRAAGNPDFWGLLIPCFPDESLTCQALEWQFTQGGGAIVEEGPEVTVNNPRVAAALDRARSWIGDIVPPDALKWDNEPTRERFMNGGGAFFRGWTYVWSVANAPDSPIAGKVGVAMLPGGSGGRAATLGGWQLAVSQYSQRKADAIELIRFLSSRRAQVKRAIDGGFPGTRTAVYDDPRVLKDLPHFQTVHAALMAAVARPSTITRDRYNEVSPIYFNRVHEVLAGRRPAAEAAALLEREIRQTLR